jgi:hypothetical protein
MMLFRIAANGATFWDLGSCKKFSQLAGNRFPLDQEKTDATG